MYKEPKQKDEKRGGSQERQCTKRMRNNLGGKQC